MTCIVGVVDGDHVLIGGDSLESDAYASAEGDSYVLQRNDEKVFVLGEFVVGFCGSYRVGQLIRYSFKPNSPKANDDNIMSYMVNEFINVLRTTMEQHGTLKTVEGEESFDAQLLVGWQNRLFVIGDDFNVGIMKDEWCAIGSGSQFALGSLHTTSELEDQISTDERIKHALRAASMYSPWCKGPYTLVRTPINNE